MNHVAPLTPEAFDIQLHELGLVQPRAEPGFDALTVLAERLLKVPATLITIIQNNHDQLLVKSISGHSEHLCPFQQVPMDQSFSQLVQTNNQPFSVNDSRQDSRLCTLFAAQELNVIAYLGVPLHLPDGTVIGSLCATDHQPRDWSRDDLLNLQDLARAADETIALIEARNQARSAQHLAQEEAAARKTFIAHMSHEIRTPLNGIIGSVDLLMRNAGGIASTPRDQGELLRTVNRSATNLQLLLNDALDIAKIDAGKLELAPAPFHPREVIEDLVALFTPNAREKNIRLEQNYDNLPRGEMRYGDGFRLGQVLGNLLSNAIKFTDQGEVCLCAHGRGDTLVIEVSDSGCGIPADKIDELFTPFVQATPTVAHEKGGTGLGMAIVRQMVDLMGGQIRAESTAGVGSVFRLSLPMPISAPTAAQSVPPAPDLPDPDQQPPAFLTGKRVLVADDSPANRLVLQKMLEQLGATVDKAYDGSDAFGRAVTTAYDVLLLDIRMPGCDGTEVVRKLRSSARHSARGALCIAVTGNTLTEQVTEYLDAGFDSWISKPLRQSDLVRVLSSLCSETRAAPNMGSDSGLTRGAAQAHKDEQG